MAAQKKRLVLAIDVIDQLGQEARAMPDLKARQLVEAILQEFRELECLTDNPDDYVLRRGDTGGLLEAGLTLDDQGVTDGMRLVLEEVVASLPAATQRPAQAAYLRETRLGKVFRLQWQPAVIGRTSEHQPLNELVAVDLKSYVTGLRVSRRHVRLFEESGVWFAENLSDNPASIVSRDGAPARPLGTRPQALHGGDALRLDRSDIVLKFIVGKQLSQGLQT